MSFEQASSSDIDSSSRDILRYAAIPLFFIAILPPLTILVWIIIRWYGGSILDFCADFSVDKVLRHWPWPSATSLGIVAAWVTVQISLLLLLPGRRVLGPPTPMGDRITYKLNGVAALLTTLLCFTLASSWLHWFSPGIVYDQMGEILMTSNVAAVICSVLLYVKGLHAPSSPDAGTSGWLVWDFYWGTELHPRVGGIDLKQLVICRLAMMGWAVILVSCAAKQVESHGHLSNSMAITCGLGLVYIFKFFWWEGGYFSTLDVMHYRFGFRNFWGVTAWLPAIYPIAALWLVDHPRNLDVFAASAIVALGIVAIWANYDADAQRERARSTGGRTTVWGREARILPVTYTTLDGTQRETVLLMSGWWGLSRHCHYLSELLLAVSWTLPAGFRFALPWFYVGYLAILLAHRSNYDDQRCQEKYGHGWRLYCERVRWRIIPFIY